MMKLDKNEAKQADFTVFAIDPRGTRASFAPPEYTDGKTYRFVGFSGSRCLALNNGGKEF